MKLIGLAGTNAAGKDTVAEMLVERHGWLFVSVSEILKQEAMNLGLTQERLHRRAISAQMRREHGVGILVDMALEQFKGQLPMADGLVVASLRNPGEADRVHELGGQVVWVDADPAIRYKRIIERARGPEDNKTFKEFLAEEEAEMHVDDDQHTLSLREVKDRSDIFLTNNGNNVETFKDQVQKVLDKYL